MGCVPRQWHNFAFPPPVTEGSTSSLTLVIITHYYYSHSTTDVSWFAFPWELVILDIFSCVCWPLVYLWKKITLEKIPFGLLALVFVFCFCGPQNWTQSSSVFYHWPKSLAPTPFLIGWLSPLWCNQTSYIFIFVFLIQHLLTTFYWD